jgi:hypothetical protein
MVDVNRVIRYMLLEASPVLERYCVFITPGNQGRIAVGTKKGGHSFALVLAIRDTVSRGATWDYVPENRNTSALTLSTEKLGSLGGASLPEP